MTDPSHDDVSTHFIHHAQEWLTIALGKGETVTSNMAKQLPLPVTFAIQSKLHEQTTLYRLIICSDHGISIMESETTDSDIPSLLTRPPSTTILRYDPDHKIVHLPHFTPSLFLRLSDISHNYNHVQNTVSILRSVHRLIEDEHSRFQQWTYQVDARLSMINDMINKVHSTS